jgi:hypothetical protein
MAELYSVFLRLNLVVKRKELPVLVVLSLIYGSETRPGR